MLKKTIITILFLFSFSHVFSQQNFSLSGKIKSESIYLKEVLVELQVKNNRKFAISNKDGNYQFININCNAKDTLTVKVSCQGFKSIVKKITVDNNNLTWDIDLEKDKIITLDEVIVNSSEKIVRTASTSTYKINQKKFIKNAKATAVLNTIPNVNCNIESGKTIVEGNLMGKIFIDGIEAMPNEVKNIDAATIDKVEIISNPSATYGTDFLGAVINIISKKSNEQFYKSSISITGGAVNNYGAISPSFNFKKGNFSFKTDISFLQNNQIINDEINRDDLNGNYIQSSINKSKTIQNSIDAKIGLKFSEKSDLTITSYNGGYNIKGNTSGSSILNNNTSDYFNISKIIHNDFDLALVYKNKISDAKTFYFKNKYAILSDYYTSDYESTQLVNNFDVKSTNRELTLNLIYDIQNLKYFKKSTSINYDAKYINRNYNFSNTDFYINQNIFNATCDMSNDWSKKISTELALTFEHSSNISQYFTKNYDLLLPTFNGLYRLKNKKSINFGYSKRVLRPNPSDLNDALIVSSPGFGKQGNSNLNQQIRNYYFLKLNKEFDNDSFSIKFYRITINNSIINVYKQQGNLLINTLDNAATFNSTGFDLDFSTKLFKKIGVNLNSGLNYNVYKTDDLSAIIKKNNGTSINSSINLFSNFFKDKVAVTLSGMYSGPDYSLLSKSVSYPYLDFSVSSNLCKNKLSLSLYAQNLLGNNATITRATSYGDNFQQNHFSKNNFTNLLLTVTYTFGKKFELPIDDNKIENIDIRK